MKRLLANIFMCLIYASLGSIFEVHFNFSSPAFFAFFGSVCTLIILYVNTYLTRTGGA